MFKRIYVDKFKCVVNFAPEIQNPALVAGYDCSGKNSVLDIMFALRELLSGRAKVADQRVFSPSFIAAWQSGNSRPSNYMQFWRATNYATGWKSNMTIGDYCRESLKEARTTGEGDRLF
ncbi:MAG: hypothetical protein OXN84_00315 [Albidovulum sp.]|nr:hypothetical protein [Albidovulum sp.]